MTSLNAPRKSSGSRERNGTVVRLMRALRAANGGAVTDRWLEYVIWCGVEVAPDTLRSLMTFARREGHRIERVHESRHQGFAGYRLLPPGGA